MKRHETMQSSIRQSDSPSVVHIDRKIPLWGILGALGLIAGQAVMMYITQREQGTLLQQTIIQNVDLSTQIKELRSAIGERSLKDVERDLRLNDVERRMRIIEDAKAKS